MKKLVNYIVKGYKKNKFFIKNCECCGKLFISKKNNLKRFCSQSCVITNRNNVLAKDRQIVLYCRTCGKKIITTNKNKIYCNSKCRYPNANKIYTKTCIICNNKFETKNKRKKCCSKECEKKSYALGGPIKSKKDIICKTCGKKFYPKKATSKYCCKECYDKDHMAKYITKICPICNKEFKISSKKSLANRMFCGKSCSATHNNNMLLEKGLNVNILNPKKQRKIGKWCEYKNIKVMSTYELRTCNILDKMVQKEDIKNWEYTKDRIKYIGLDNNQHYYLIDFKITNNDNTFFYLEIKGFKTEKDDLKWNETLNQGYKLKVWFLKEIEIMEQKYNISKIEIKNLLDNGIIKSKEDK